MLLRHTVGTLALLFAYAAGGEALLALLPVDGPRPVEPHQQRVRLGARRRPGLRRERGVPPEPGPDCDQRLSVTLVDGAMYLGVLLLVTLLVSVLLFRRRDVP